MLGSNYGHTTIKLFILLAMCCGIQADCAGLTVYHEDEKIDTNSVCVRKYKTSACENFVSTFNQSDLPEDFPKNYPSVERPSNINILGRNYTNGKTVHPGMSIIWKSPLSEAGRRNCVGYLLVWFYSGSKNKQCQLFQLNRTNEILFHELQYEFLITRILPLATYTVVVYSMPLINARNNDEPTFVKMNLATPSIYLISELGIEPAKWAPFIAYKTFDDGTIDVRFVLPHPSLNLTRFSVELSHESDNSPFYTKDYRPQLHSGKDQQGVLKLAVNKTGCYKLQVWVLEEEGNYNIPGQCSCWTFQNQRKECENVCGSTFLKICLNVTKPADTQTSSPTTVMPVTRMNTSLITPSVTSSLTPAGFHQIPEVIVGGVIGLLLILAIAVLILCCYRKNYTVKLFVYTCTWCCSLARKPKPQYFTENEHLPKPKIDKPTKPILPSLTKKSVYIMYADDHKPHLKLVEAFSLFLERHCHCKVIKPSSHCDDYESGVYEWFVCNINMADYIIFINSEGAENLILAHLKNRSYNTRRLTTVEDTFHYGLKHLLLNKEARERHLILVSFQGKHCQKYLQAPEIHMLPENLPHLIWRIHNLNAKTAMAYSNLLPLQLENVPNLPEGMQLYSAIKDVKDYEKHNPHWCEKSFGTLILPSIDSGCSSGLHNCTNSVSTQDLTLSETTSPVSVFEQPNFAGCLDTSTLHDISGPQALTYSKYLPHSHKCDGNCVFELEKNLQDTNSCNDSENLNDKLQYFKIDQPHFNDLSKLENDQIKQETGTFDEVSIVPPESLNGIVYDSYSMALAKINTNEELIHQFSQIPINCNGSIYLEFENVEPINIAEMGLTPPDNLSNIQVDSISSALLAINANSERDRNFFRRDEVVT